MTSTAMRHLERLAVGIGPRGSTTAAERRAAEHASQHFESLGLETHFEPFRAPTSGWRPFALAALIGLLSVALFWFGGRAGAFVAGGVMLVTTASVFLEMYFRRNPLRALLAWGESQNVWARVPARGEARRRVLVVGHLDTHRTPWVFTTPSRLAFFKLMTTVGVAGFVLGSLFFLASATFGLEPIRWLALLLVPVYAVVLALTAQPDTTPHTSGANDNASGAGVVLSLAERLAAAPLEHTEVWVMGSGCEEVGSYGAQAFVARHRDELAGLAVISVDNVGGDGTGVCYTSREGMVFPLRPSPELFTLAEELRATRPDLDAYTQPYATLHTDATCFMSHGVPSLSFVGLRRDGVIPEWHQVSDTLERVDPAAVERTETFVLELLRRLDATAASA
jgi:hypothetical protein